MTEERKEEIKPSHLAGWVLFAIAISVFVCVLVHFGAKEDALLKEREDISEANRAYERENTEYLSLLVNEMADCQRQDEKGYEKNNCTERHKEISKKRDQLEQHKIELNYRIEKAWPKK